jgi:hypothetical protein
MRYSAALAHVIGQRAWLLAIALFLFEAALPAQVSERITAVRADAYRAGAPLHVTVELSNTVGVDRIEIAYRQFGQRLYARRELALSGNTAAIDIPAADVAPPLLDYYLAVYGAAGTVIETYPPADAENHPNQIQLRDEPGVASDVIILSPDARERLNAEEVVISFSLLRADTTVDRTKTKVYLDEADLSGSLVIDDELVVVPADRIAGSLSAGEHAVRVELYDREGSRVSTSGWTFVVRATSDASSLEAAPDYATWKYRGSAQLEARNENINSDVTPFRRATLSANATSGAYQFTGRMHVTNEEKADRQPQNRFFIGGESPWVKLGYGDTYPELSDLIMSGKRIRGFNGALMLGPVQLEVVSGAVTRSVASEVLGVFSADSLAAEQQRDPSGAFIVYDTAAVPQRWARVRYGTFDRNLFVIRPSIGKEDSRISFSYLKAKDDIGSVKYGIRPQENMVVGSDFLLSFDRHGIELTGQAAIGFVNKDITGGTLSDADIDSIFAGSDGDIDPQDVRDLKKYLGNYITVNQNLVPLSLKNTSTIAYDAGLRLNYFNNVFRFSFFRHGESFQSFGQSFYRADIKGFAVTDRLRLANNRVLLAAGLERFDDNTAQTKASTTTSTTGNVGLSYLSPTEFPSVTLGYLLADNKNTVPADSFAAVDDRTNRFLVQLNRQFTYVGQHSASLGFSTSSRDDRSRRNLDATTIAFTLGNSTRFSFPLETNVTVAFNSTEFSSVDTSLQAATSTFHYTTLSASGLYRFLDGRLHCAATLSPTFGDIARTLADASARYYFQKNLSLQTQLSLYFNKSAHNDVIWSVILRMDV